MEKFNAKTHENIPAEKGGGYVRKEAAEHTREADKMAEVVSILKEENISAQDLLHTEALEENTIRERRKAMEQEVAEKGEDESKLFWLNELRENGLDTVEFPSSKARPDYRIIPEKWRGDREFILEALKIQPGFSGHGGDSLVRFASDGLKNDKSFVLEVLKINPDLFGQATSPELKDDQDFVLKVMQEIGQRIECSSRLENSKTFVLRAIKASNGEDLTSEDLNGELDYMNEYEMEEDREIAAERLKRLKKDDFSYALVSEELLHDIEFLVPLIRENPRIINVIFKEYSFSDPRYDPSEVRKMGHSVWTKVELLSLAVRILKDNPGAVQYFPEELKKEISGAM